jgi:glutathione S-transferase
MAGRRRRPRAATPDPEEPAEEEKKVADYELYWFPGTCARVAFVALEEIGAPFKVNVPDLVAERDQVRKVSPKGRVPVLVSDEGVVTENPVLLPFLARRHPEASLLPTGDPLVERDVLETMAWFASAVHPRITRLRFPIYSCKMESAWPSIKEAAATELAENFELIEQRLEAREWLFGDWSIVDVYLLWLWFRAAGSGMDFSRFPRTADLASRCQERPTVAKVLDREEAEWARLEKEKDFPPGFFPAFQVGRAPTL